MNEVLTDLCEKVREAAKARRRWLEADKTYRLAQKELELASAESRRAQDETIKALERADVRSDGNYGWESRWWRFMYMLLGEDQTSPPEER